MRRRFLGLLGLGLALAAAAAGLFGCNDTDPTWGSLAGTVTDSQGTPLAGARVNLGYTLLLGADTLSVPPLSANVGPLTIEPDTSIVLTVFDHLGREVWSGTGSSLAWDGRDEDGNFVPDGPYRLTLVVPQIQETYERWLILIRSGLDIREQMAVATTGDDGTFEIPYPEIPVWQGYPVTVAGSDPDSILSGDAVFDKTFQIYAFRGDGTTVHASETVRLDGRYRSKNVTLVIP